MEVTDKKASVFGTDGVRGMVGTFPITAEFVLKLGWAVAMALSAQQESRVLIGKDTRISGYMLESALLAGLTSAGINSYLLGPIPTPAVAYLTRTLRVDIGIVISASHNPYDDNGIKFFSADGYKISKEVEEEIGYWLSQPAKTSVAKKLGRIFRVNDAQGRYIEFCKSSVPHKTHLKNLKIVVDCANGASYHAAPLVFAELGADVIAIYTDPNGFNINEKCGSMHPDVLQKRVLEEKADVGIALDGDGDRVVMVDHCGEILDGDQLLYIVAKSLLATKRLTGGVIGTYLSNKGLELALNELGIHFLRVAVGDQNIIDGLKSKGWIIGGEPSGHMIDLNVSTTADGIITALQVLQAMQEAKQSLYDLKQGIKRLPQLSTKIPHYGNQVDLQHSAIGAAIKNAEMLLGQRGRILVRYSGTEPVIRIMVEGEDKKLIEKIMQELITTVTDVIQEK